MQFGAQAEPRVFVVWFGPALLAAPQMSDTRSQCLESLRSDVGLEVVFITDENIEDWVVPGQPFHPAFRWLSANHKSDYLRAYLMHHHGGGYSDVKRPQASWAPALELLNSSSRLFGVGYAEPSARTVATMIVNPGRSKARRVVDPKWWTHRILQHEYHRLIANSGFIFRSRSSFTSRWFSQVTRRMNSYAGALEGHPAQHALDGNGIVHNGVASNYPIPWLELQGNIFHPLCLRYFRHLSNTLPELDATNYR